MNLFSCNKQVKLTVHKAIKVTKDSDKAELKAKCTEVIYSVLPPVYEDKKQK